MDNERLPTELLISMIVIGLLIVVWGVLAATHLRAELAPTRTLSPSPTFTPSLTLPTVTYTIVPSATPPPTPTPTSTPTPTPTPTPTILPTVIFYFRVTPARNVPLGAELTLRWKYEKYSQARIVEQIGTRLRPDQRYWKVKNEGSLEITAPQEYNERLVYILYVFDRDEVVASSQVSVSLKCPYTWFFTPPLTVCPDGPPIKVEAVEQRFEGGRMIRLARGLWDESPVIYVLYDEKPGKMWTAFADEWHEGMPEADPDLEPPPGKLQPLRGLGKVWRENDKDVREPLGWAVERQVVYRAQVQSRSIDGRYPTIYISAADGRVYVLHPGEVRWEIK